MPQTDQQKQLKRLRKRVRAMAPAAMEGDREAFRRHLVNLAQSIDRMLITYGTKQSDGALQPSLFEM